MSYTQYIKKSSFPYAVGSLTQYINIKHQDNIIINRLMPISLRSKIWYITFIINSILNFEFCRVPQPIPINMIKVLAMEAFTGMLCADLGLDPLFSTKPNTLAQHRIPMISNTYDTHEF